MRTLLTQLTRFGLVGLIGLVIDVSVFNLLRVTVLSPEALHEGPVIAKVISTSLAIVANWMGNRHWTFARERRGHLAREGAEFFLVSFGGMLIGLFCLWLSHYVLGYQSLLADNISSNVIGLALGTAFRFWGYRVWVFRESRYASDSVGRYSTTDLPVGGSIRARLVSTLRQAHGRPRFARSTSLSRFTRKAVSTGSTGFDRLNPLNGALGATEGSIAPAGGTPAHRIQAVTSVEDDARPHH